MTSTTAVKQDLVISAYKPNSGLEQRLAERGAAPESAWDFVQTHLRQLPDCHVVFNFDVPWNPDARRTAHRSR